MKELKEGMYYVDTIKPAFISVIGYENDFTEMIGDFSAFTHLGVDHYGDFVQLINTPDKGFIIVPCPSVDGRFIRVNEILKFKEEGKMDETGMNRELTPEERIEQLEKEKAALELQIKKQAKYDEFRKAGDDLALGIKAMQDSGFSRDEAMQILMMANMGNIISQPLRRR